ncbi:MAG: hypothetical protein JXR19_07380 [Bacteroidia bacterium]
MKNIFFGIAMCILQMSAISQTTCTSNGGNNWATAFNCSGSGTPVIYVIQASDSVFCDVNSTTSIDTIKIYGVLEFKNGSKIDLSSTGIIQVFSGGTVIGGNAGSKFRFAGGVTINGTFNVSGPAYAQNSSSFTIGSVPVDWLYFAADQVEDMISLSWATATEINNAGFEVQYSLDGIEFIGFNWVASLHPDGNSKEITEYEALVEPLKLEKSSSYFFRIKQQDYDGVVSYSKIITFMGDERDGLDYRLNNNQLHLTLNSNETLEYSLIDPLGRVIQTGELIGSGLLAVDSKGLYTLVTYKRSERTIYKIMNR